MCCYQTEPKTTSRWDAEYDDWGRRSEAWIEETDRFLALIFPLASKDLAESIPTVFQYLIVAP
jgi:hypothetical protein